ncbi:SDR family oxidoreductase [Bdellovibrio sp. 22V]|uniref:SDR family oxidoreductase n=1 Tax=Bdellovibrio TaxID=958 RepID=UPI0025427020|nr:SDR family oxidoreductase [Bdellovibrio sp. 22V]WII70738.1 SDR family oxidoreductase [Bdellovibrio sp. 22V]
MAKSFKPKPLEQQTLVITGASSGIGLATAEMAARRGANVVICSRNEEDLRSIAEKLNVTGGSVLPVRADVRSLADLDNVRREAESKFGNIDTWVNNAGGSVYGPLLEIPEAEERELFETNFWGVRHGCHVAVDAMRARGGVLVNIGSEVSARSIPLQGIYSCTKHAVKAYTDALRMELSFDKIPIEVCLIRPTAINTPFPDHAVNRLRNGEPSLPDPAYHPDYVAEAILKCAVDPERDIYVGAPSMMTAVMEFLMPETTDMYMEKKLFKDQSKGTSLNHDRKNEGLFNAPPHEGELTGHHRGKIKEKKNMKERHLTDDHSHH